MSPPPGKNANGAARAPDAMDNMRAGEALDDRSIGVDGQAAERDLSNWNLLFERKLALGPDLSRDEHRLLDALARCLLGFNKTADRLGEGLLRERSGLHGKSFARTRAALIEKGLLVFESGGRGRGKRSLYALILDPAENPARERDFAGDPDSLENPAPARAFSSQNPAENPAENPAPERGRIEKGVGEVRSTSPASEVGDEADLAGEARSAAAVTTEEDPMEFHSRPAAEDEALLAKLRTVPAGELRDRVERDWRNGDGARAVLRACVERATLGDDLDLDRLARLLDETPVAFVVAWGWFLEDEGEHAFGSYRDAAAEIERLTAAGVENVKLGVATGADALAYLEGEAA